MAKPRPSIVKRNRERALQQKRREKASLRAERAAARKERSEQAPEGDEDPDIAHIVPGPQPLPWDDSVDEHQHDE